MIAELGIYAHAAVTSNMAMTAASSEQVPWKAIFVHCNFLLHNHYVPLLSKPRGINLITRYQRTDIAQEHSLCNRTAMLDVQGVSRICMAAR